MSDENLAFCGFTFFYVLFLFLIANDFYNGFKLSKKEKCGYWIKACLAVGAVGLFPGLYLLEMTEGTTDIITAFFYPSVGIIPAVAAGIFARQIVFRSSTGQQA
jgi:hypothetical protein